MRASGTPSLFLFDGNGKETENDVRRIGKAVSDATCLLARSMAFFDRVRSQQQPIRSKERTNDRTQEDQLSADEWACDPLSIFRFPARKGVERRSERLAL